ncbi:MAG: hypothetical protein ONB23_02710 [candidate division KSB1 bacterium]|nr:hypothetical protein [candidate division KSB1 bacterium]
MRKSRLLALILLAGTACARGQDFRFSIYRPHEIEKKAEDLADYLGTILGAGLIHSAEVQRTGDLQVGMRVISVFVPARYSEVSAGPLRDEEFFWFPLLHASIGLPGRLEILVRGTPLTMGHRPARGTVWILGGGLKIGVLQEPWSPHLSVAATYHCLAVPPAFEIGDAAVVSLRLAASLGSGPVSFYGTLGPDWCRLPVEIPRTGHGEYAQGWTHSYDRLGFVGALGVALRPIRFLVANLEYAAAKFSGFNAGITFGFR